MNGFTTVFVVPIMLVEGCGVLAGWGRLWLSIRTQWKQYLAYAFMGFVLSLVGGLVVGIGTTIPAVLLLIPFGALFAVGFFALGAVQPAGIAIMVLAAAGYVLDVIAIAVVGRIPVQSYLRYYALLVLGDVDPDLDPVPDQRAAIRDGATAAGG